MVRKRVNETQMTVATLSPAESKEQEDEPMVAAWMFDGNHCHEVIHLNGTRISMMAYTVKGYKTLQSTPGMVNLRPVLKRGLPCKTKPNDLSSLGNWQNLLGPTGAVLCALH